jgi:hypothetical protein
VVDADGERIEYGEIQHPPNLPKSMYLMLSPNSRFTEKQRLALRKISALHLLMSAYFGTFTIHQLIRLLSGDFGEMAIIGFYLVAIGTPISLSFTIPYLLTYFKQYRLILWSSYLINSLWLLINIFLLWIGVVRTDPLVIQLSIVPFLGSGFLIYGLIKAHLNK